LRELDSEFERAGIAVRFIVIGDAEKVATFCGAHGMADRCIADEDKATFKAAGLGEFGWLGFLTDTALKARRKENNAAGFRQNWGATRLADATQLPS
jgi:hypothetical protein